MSFLFHENRRSVFWATTPVDVDVLQCYLNFWPDNQHSLARGYQRIARKLGRRLCRGASRTFNRK
jgi:hypothetical protein